MIGTDTGVYIKALEDTHVNLLFESDFPVEQLNVLYSANMLITRTGKVTRHTHQKCKPKTYISSQLQVDNV